MYWLKSSLQPASISSPKFLLYTGGKAKSNPKRRFYCLSRPPKDLEAEVYREVQNVHSYDTPELITLPITNGSETYLDWMTAAVRKQ